MGLEASDQHIEDLSSRWLSRWTRGVPRRGVESLDEYVVVAVSGPEEPPPVSELAELVSQRLGRGVTVELRWIPQTSTVAVTARE